MKELTRRGFKYTLVHTDKEFIEKLDNFDIAWILDLDPFDTRLTNDLLKSLDVFFKDSKSLYIWADNDPLFYRSNIILQHYFNGMNLKGNFYGDKILTASDDLVKGTFDKNHPISYGVNNLYEGVTICHPEKMHDDFKVYAINTNNEPLVVYAEANDNHGRIIVDCGFTKHWDHYW